MLTARIADNLDLEASALLQDVSSDDESADRLAPSIVIQRPERQANFALRWRPTSGLGLRAETIFIGKAFDMSDDGAISDLPSAWSLNLRAFVDVTELKGGGKIRLTLNADNVADALVLPQLGLPAPGRTIRAGISFHGV